MDFSDILNNGIYYCPATKHYTGQNVVVFCDRCDTADLSCCIGYLDKDLCLLCVAALNHPKIQRRQEIITFNDDNVYRYLTQCIGNDYEEIRAELSDFGYHLDRRFDNDECDRGYVKPTALVSWRTNKILSIIR